MSLRTQPWAGRYEPRLSPSARTRYRRYLRWVAPQLGLEKWWVVVRQEAAEPMSNAQVEVRPAAWAVRVWLSATFNKLSQDDQRRALIHELLHIHIDPMHKALADLKPHLSPELYGYAYDTFERALETAVESLAFVLAPYFPTPSEFEKNPPS